MSKFFCDTNCELWWDKVEEFGVNVIKMPYTVGDDTYEYDLGKETDHAAFFKRLKNKEKPATQALNPTDYIELFEPVLAAGEDIIYVHFSHKLSGTFDYMNTAINELKEKYPKRKITTVDTLNISMGAGFLVYEAMKMWKAKKSDSEIKAWVEKNRQKVGIYFVVDDLNFLKRGGRLSSTAAMFGTLLKVKPILKVDEEGKIVPTIKAKGMHDAIKKLVEIISEKGDKLENHFISIIHADVEKLALELKSKIRETISPSLEIWVQPVGPTIGAHCGPGTIGVVFHAKER